MDVIYFKIFRSHRIDDNLLKIIEHFQNKDTPTMPIKANTLMQKYNIPEGKILGNKLREIEGIWVNNNFQISEKEVEKVVNS